MDFLNYWDTRIDANERFFNNYPHIANFAFVECQELWDRMSADYAALKARHNALRDAVHMAMGRTVGCDKKQTDDQIIADVAYLKRLASDHFKTSIDCGNRAFAVEQKYDALREAVKRLRKIEGHKSLHLVLDGLLIAARAEVDRLLQEPPC